MHCRSSRRVSLYERVRQYLPGNRYTDWGNYYPYRTLRNLWMLSRYVPAEKMQIEFLNKWRNADKYDAADLLPPPVTVSITSLPSPWRRSRWLGWRLRTCPKRLILRHLCSRSTNPCNSSFIKASYCPLVKNLRDVRGPDSNRPSPARKAILLFTVKTMSNLGGLLTLGFLRVRKLLLPL